MNTPEREIFIQDRILLHAGDDKMDQKIGQNSIGGCANTDIYRKIETLPNED